MKILITGGTGFLGKSILEFLKFSNLSDEISEVYLNSRNPEKVLSSFSENIFSFKLSLIKQDLKKKFDFDIEVDYIIHAAAESGSSLGFDNPLEMRNVIVEGTKNVLDFAKKKKIKRILFISSGAVYGTQPPNMDTINEECLNAPNVLLSENAYGCAKRQAENLFSLYEKHYNINFVIARCFAFVGPYLPLDEHFAIGNFINDGLLNRDIIVKGNGKTIRSYLFADDLCDWLFKILFNGRSGEAYNVGSEEKINMHQLAQLVSKCFNDKPDVKIIGEHNTNVSTYVPNIDKIKNELNARQNYDLIESINRTIHFHK